MPRSLRKFIRVKKNQLRKQYGRDSSRELELIAWVKDKRQKKETRWQKALKRIKE